MARLAAVIVAAGSSSRLGQPKQLLALGGESLLGRTIRLAGEAGVSSVVVVLGAHRETIETRLNLSSIKVIVNDRWPEGLASSIRAGVSAAAEIFDADGVLLLPCDQPRLTADHLGEMVEAFARSGDAMIASVYDGKRGTPAIFPRSVFGNLLALHGDVGARGLLAGAERHVVELPLPGGEVDIDYPEDLALLL